LSIRDLTPQQREELELKENIGVLVDKIEPGPASDAGILSGDAILMLNNKQVTSAKQFAKLVEELPAGKSVAVLVQRASGRMFMALRVPE
jgi:serine protease Do